MICCKPQPNITLTWEEFVRDTEPYSIALDGYVSAPPKIHRSGPYANFDHHTGVIRLTTRSTASQVFMALNLGLFDLFQVDGVPTANLYFNHPDEDVCLSCWLIRNPDRWSSEDVGGRLAQLLVVEDILDTTGGSYPVRYSERFLEEQAWIFAPYSGIAQKSSFSAPDMMAVIEEVGARIEAYLVGRGGRLEVDSTYTAVGGGRGWKLITNAGPYARSRLLKQGIFGCVTAVKRAEDVWDYSLCGMTPFAYFPLLPMYDALNLAEGCPPTDAWGGSGSIGGSPRGRGSSLRPNEVESIINEILV
jgi:hypothetical protein